MTLRQIVSDYFGDYVGKFLEIGANDCHTNYDEEPFSHLLEKGWYGLYCEPNPFSLVNLIKNTQKYNVDILCAAVDFKPELKKFYSSESHPYLSSLVPEWIDNWATENPDHFLNRQRNEYEVFVKTITPVEIFKKFGTDFDCLSIDIEVYPPQTHMILKSIDFKQVKSKMVIVEGSFSYTNEYMSAFGFTTDIHGGNTIYTR